MNNREKVQPQNKDELALIIKKECKEKGWECDLNFIDTSLINNMSYLFYKKTSYMNSYDLDKFNGDISSWDVSSVENMESMFDSSIFDGDISKWDVNKVTNMSCMFFHSIFNQDISRWNTSSVINMKSMFFHSIFDNDISLWNTSSVTNMSFMFQDSIFNSDISSWDVSKVTNMNLMFNKSKFNKDIGNWKVYNLEIIYNMFSETNIILPYWYKDYKEDEKERKKQIDEYHKFKNLNQSLENNIILKNNKPKKI